jgi:hypothetical protein
MGLLEAVFVVSGPFCIDSIHCHSKMEELKLFRPFVLPFGKTWTLNRIHGRAICIYHYSTVLSRV